VARKAVINWAAFIKFNEVRMAFLELKQVSKLFTQFTAVDSFNLEVEQGEFVSFLGPSGCGKTTTLRMIAGFEMPTSGDIFINGENVTNKPPNRRNVGMVFQSYALFPNMTVAENIGFGLKVDHKPAAEIKERVAEMLDLIHMAEFGDRFPSQLSGGQQQRVALARALAIRPQVLLLDEPLSALDAKIRVRLRGEIRAIQRQLCITTIYVTHDQEEALSLSDRVVVMNMGHVEQIGAPFEIYNFPKTQFVASFVGTLNLVEAIVQDPKEGCLKLEGQSIATTYSLTEYRPGDTALLALRPEMFSLEPPDQVENKLVCTVDNVNFLGSVVRVQVNINHTPLYFDLFNHPNLALPKVKEPVTLYFSPDGCMIMSGERKAKVEEAA
jgi:putative spermidine/putrescine transport system ATP-binding protein